MINKLHKKYILIFGICFLHIINVINNIYAGSVVYDGDELMYKFDNGSIATSSWIWIDTNNDSIAECYHFNSKGYLSKNYVSEFNQKTNELGQLVEDNIVIKKMLSSGTIIKSPIDDGGNQYVIWDSNAKAYKKVPKVNETQNKIIKTVEIIDDFIGPVATKSEYIIYANANSVNNSEYELSDGTVIKETPIAGKNLKNYITSSNKCDLEKEKARIYTGIYWKDVIEFKGDEAYIKIDLKKNNYIYFEVANEKHSIDEREYTMSLDMYVDGELYDTIEDFIDSEPLKYEERFYDNEKTVELKLKITGNYTYRKVYLRNGRLKKLRDDED